MNFNNQNQEFDWNAAIEDDSEGFKLLETGDRNAVISWIDRGRYNGSERIPPCNMATITLRIQENGEIYELQTRLYICKKMEWKLSEFFRGIGRKKHGERLVMNWDGLIGLPVRVRVVKKDIPGRDGEKKTVNEVTKFYDYDPSFFPADTSWMQEAAKAEEEPLDEVF